MSTSPQQVAQYYSDWSSRYSDRDRRHQIMDEVLRGNIDVVDPDEEEVENRSPNLILVALEDTAEAAALIPTVRVQPTKTSDKAREQARKMEKIGAGVLQANNIDLLIPKTVLDLGAYGLHAWTVMPDPDENRAIIERRDPRQCYPEPGFRPGDMVRRAIFARQVYWSQLPPEYQVLMSTHMMNDQDHDFDMNANIKVSIVEYFDEKEIVLVGVVEGAKISYGSDGRAVHSYVPIEIARQEHGLDVCPVVIEGRLTWDGEFRGQFDQVVGMMAAHVRLMGMMLDYADQAVYSDVWVRDLVGKMPYGGGAYIELGQNGAIGRVPPAVTSLNVQQDLEALVDGIHVGGRWPKSRPGEIDQSIASAKFLETSAGIMNTAIRTYHMILQRSIEKALRLAFAVETVHFAESGPRTAHGVLRNQEFLFEYNPKTAFDMTASVRVEYGLGLGKDPSQSAVLHIQYAKEKFISNEFVQENIDGVTDVAREQSRIDVEDFRKMAMAKLLEGLQAGMVPEKALIEIVEGRRNGDDLFKLYDQYIVQPKEEQAEQQIPSGLGGPMSPGVLPGGAAPPAGPGGPQPPPAPGGADLLARMNSPAGPGGMIGTQVEVPG